MAFDKVESWTVEAGQGAARVSSGRITSIVDAIVYQVAGTGLRRLGALIGTAIVHLGLLLFLLFKLSDVVPRAGGEAGDNLTLIDLGRDTEAEQPAASSPAAAPAPAEPASPIDSSKAALPVEWTVAKILVARPSAPLIAAPKPSSSIAASASAASGGGIYDPYAGASPRWLQPPPSFRSAQNAGADPITLTASAIRPDLLRQLRVFLRRGDSASPPLRLLLTIESGQVVNVALVEGLPPAATKAVQRIFLGQKPFTKSDPALGSLAGAAGPQKVFVTI